MQAHVQLFTTCLVSNFFPRIARSATKVLARAGAEVVIPPGQTCCGQPAFNAGMRSEAQKMAKHTIRTLERLPKAWESSEVYVVLPSGSCAAMIRQGYAELFADDPGWLERAIALAKRTYEFTEFLVDVSGVTQLGVGFPGTLTYHPSCHLLRELGVNRQPRALLEGIQEAKIVELPHAEECCGFGGIFAVNHPELSTAMLERKIANIENSQAPVCVTCDAGCLMHIQGGLHRQGKSQQVVHIAEILSYSNPDIPTTTKQENPMAPASTPRRK